MKKVNKRPQVVKIITKIVLLLVITQVIYFLFVGIQFAFFHFFRLSYPLTTEEAIETVAQINGYIGFVEGALAIILYNYIFDKLF